MKIIKSIALACVCGGICGCVSVDQAEYESPYGKTPLESTLNPLNPLSPLSTTSPTSAYTNPYGSIWKPQQPGVLKKVWGGK